MSYDNWVANAREILCKAGDSFTIDDMMRFGSLASTMILENVRDVVLRDSLTDAQRHALDGSIRIAKLMHEEIGDE